MTALKTLADHGLKRPDIVALIELERIGNHEYVVKPGKAFSAEADRVYRMLRDTPELAARYLDGLVALGRYGSVLDDDLDGVRHMRDRLIHHPCVHLYIEKLSKTSNPLDNFIQNILFLNDYFEGGGGLRISHSFSDTLYLLIISIICDFHVLRNG